MPGAFLCLFHECARPSPAEGQDLNCLACQVCLDRFGIGLDDLHALLLFLYPLEGSGARRIDADRLLDGVAEFGRMGRREADQRHLRGGQIASGLDPDGGVRVEYIIGLPVELGDLLERFAV